MNMSLVIGVVCYVLAAVLLAFQFFQDSLIPNTGFMTAAFGCGIIGTIWFMITTLENMQE